MSSESVRRRGFLLASLAVVATGAVAALAVVSDSPPGGANEGLGYLEDVLECLPHEYPRTIHGDGPEPLPEPEPQSPEQGLQEVLAAPSFARYVPQLVAAAPADFEVAAETPDKIDYRLVEDGRAVFAVRLEEYRPGDWVARQSAWCSDGR